MLRFSIREIMLLMLCVACFVGWGKEWATAAAERAKLAAESQKVRESIPWQQARIDVLTRECSNLELENARLTRRMVEHNLQLDLLLDRFRNDPPDS